MNPLLAEVAVLQHKSGYVTIVNPDGTFKYEPNSVYKQPTIIRRTYRQRDRSKYRYALQQEGNSYRCCQWSRFWCSRQCQTCSFCDRIISCPLFCFIFIGLLIILLLTAIAILIGLHPNINSARYYYGIISKLSIFNQTTYIYGLDSLCNKYSSTRNCLAITTSTAKTNLTATLIINRCSFFDCQSFLSYLAISFGLFIYSIMNY